MKRRHFLRTSASVLATWGLGGLPHSSLRSQADSEPVISVARGKDFGLLLEKALFPFGGIKKFVHRGDKVVILPNPQGSRPGVSTSALLVGQMVKLCLEGGASAVEVASIHSPGRWFGTGIVEAVEQAGGKMYYPRHRSDWVDIAIQRGRCLKKATILRKAMDNDVLINLPIAKQHDSTGITASLKNLMGFNQDNASFHQGKDYLHQAIVDLATLFSPRLIVVDAFTILAENGPFGPGRLVSPQSVVVGTDMVAVDAYCCRFLGIQADEILYLQLAHEAGLGNKNLSGQKIVEAQG